MSGWWGVRGAVIAVALVWCSVLAAPAFGADRIYWANLDNAGSVSFANLDGSGNGGDLPATGASPVRPSGLAIDAAAGKVYWPNQSLNQISVANLDGSGGAVLDTAGAPFRTATGIAIDPAAGRIYWANALNDTIAFAETDGSGGGTLSTEGAPVDQPLGVAVDPAAGKIYWTNNAGSAADAIGFANLDGSGGGGQLSTTGAMVNQPFGLALDRAGGRLYVANGGNDSVSVINLDGSGGAPLSVAGAGLDQPVGVAIDPAAGRLYVANFMANSISFVNLDGSGGGSLSTTGATARSPVFPALLKAPAGVGTPTVSGGAELGQTLSCGQGDWAPDELGAFLYRAPASFDYAWLRDGVEVSGATDSTFEPTEGGEYRCRVAATNAAGSTAQTSAARSISAPQTPSIRITGVKRDRDAGTAALTVTTNVPGTLWLATTKKVGGTKPAEVGAGEAALDVVPRGGAVKKLRRKGRVSVNPRVRFTPADGGDLGVRRELRLRLDRP